MTRSVVPYLAERGITGLTIGSNGADIPPSVPKLHRWVDRATGADVIVAYHPYGYGGYVGKPFLPRICPMVLLGCFIPPTPLH